LNAALFARIKAVDDQKAKLGLTAEQARLLERTVKQFVRNGAALDEAKKAELRKVNEELAVLSQKFGQNVLAEDNGFTLVLESKDDLAGLPPTSSPPRPRPPRPRARRASGPSTLHKPSCIPFFQYSARRDLREKLFKAFIRPGPPTATPATTGRSRAGSPPCA